MWKVSETGDDFIFPSRNTWPVWTIRRWVWKHLMQKLLNGLSTETDLRKNLITNYYVNNKLTSPKKTCVNDYNIPAGGLCYEDRFLNSGSIAIDYSIGTILKDGLELTWPPQRNDSLAMATAFRFLNNKVLIIMIYRLIPPPPPMFMWPTPSEMVAYQSSTGSQ